VPKNKNLRQPQKGVKRGKEAGKGEDVEGKKAAPTKQSSEKSSTPAEKRKCDVGDDSKSKKTRTSRPDKPKFEDIVLIRRNGNSYPSSGRRQGLSNFPEPPA
jgi:outer membrane biosynthesis protein TonB